MDIYYSWCAGGGRRVVFLGGGGFGSVFCRDCLWMADEEDEVYRRRCLMFAIRV